MWFNQYPYINLNDLNLDWIIKHFREFVESIASLEEWRATHEEEYEELKNLYDDIMEGNFPDSMVNALKEWLSSNAIDIIGELVKMVFFGITDDGYFVAYIPDSWSDIIFGTTGLDDFPAGVEYGHLTLSFNVGG
jgi:hypothetical protein